MSHSPERLEGRTLPITPTPELLSRAISSTAEYDAAQIQFNEAQAKADREMRQIAGILSQRLLDLGGNTSDIIVKLHKPSGKPGLRTPKIYTAYRPLDGTLRIITSYIHRGKGLNLEHIASDVNASDLPGAFGNYGSKIVEVLSGRITGAENRQKRLK